MMEEPGQGGLFPVLSCSAGLIVQTRNKKRAGHVLCPALFSAWSAEALEAFALETLAFHFTGAAHGLSRLTRFTLGRLFEMTTQLHFTEDAFTLHFFLERFESLIDIVVTDENVHLATNPCFRKPG
ncbi:hypothetical protein AD951_15555 [Acetobacter malorum]|uniref:Uncharacterized protein n=2 Tax=Acetobacter TaxID=434 RepID=A0A149UI79_9PROT|nr:hypothetical protein AD951_15555 [Acetobacter malorum]